ncbi:MULTISPECIES: hypothetical protein [unclassified Mesorhizobium]|uniref:hypothetical protein n=1 Tax=unclassified Mesorhizobium TaxID=325217 RepID=UPI00333CFB23
MGYIIALREKVWYNAVYLRETMMYSADIGIVGGGLGRLYRRRDARASRISIVLIDVHHPCAEDFCCEKIEEKHFKLLRETGGSMEGIPSKLFTELWIARFGRVINKRASLVLQQKTES